MRNNESNRNRRRNVKAAMHDGKKFSPAQNEARSRTWIFHSQSAERKSRRPSGVNRVHASHRNRNFIHLECAPSESVPEIPRCWAGVNQSQGMQVASQMTRNELFSQENANSNERSLRREEGIGERATVSLPRMSADCDGNSCALHEHSIPPSRGKGSNPLSIRGGVQVT